MTGPPQPPSASQQLVNQLIDSANVDQQTLRAERTAVPSAVTRRRAVNVALAMAVPVLAAILLATFAWQPLISMFESPPSPAMAGRQAQEILEALVVEIDSFRSDYHQLPATLAEIGVPPRGRWSYAASGNGHYKVEGTLYGQVVRFDSSRIAAPPIKERQ